MSLLETSFPEPLTTVRVLEYRDHSLFTKMDYVATEEPLEIRVIHGSYDAPVTSKVALSMRTPGNDFELALGFLYSEGVIRSRDDVERVSYCTDPNEPQRFNIVNVRLKVGVKFDPSNLSRNVFTSSACGVCGKATLENLKTVCPTKPLGEITLNPSFIASLSEKLKLSQRFFLRTGGVHASALFEQDGSLLLIRDDVGRHNAMDKLIGSLLLEKKLPASNKLVMVSGRASFELVQKAILAGIPVLVAVGAPSSLAVELAQEYNLTLIGFLRDDKFNVYSGFERIAQ